METARGIVVLATADNPDRSDARTLRTVLSLLGVHDRLLRAGRDGLQVSSDNLTVLAAVHAVPICTDARLLGTVLSLLGVHDRLMRAERDGLQVSASFNRFKHKNPSHSSWCLAASLHYTWHVMQCKRRHAQLAGVDRLRAGLEVPHA